jgi:hypothetical protein
MAKHPDLPLDATKALRLQLAETAERAYSPRGVSGESPLRYRLVDGLNTWVKRIPAVHEPFKRALSWVGRRG